MSLCRSCGHVQTTPLQNIERYYATHYRISLASEEADQLYEYRNGEAVLRTQHQAATFLTACPLAQAAKILDYGAAKGATTRRVRAARPDVQLFLFDVSDQYREYWSSMVPQEQTASFETPASWDASFDVVACFFVLEHVPNLLGVGSHLRRLLRPDGLLYFVVPNYADNVGDFIVADHINHFSAASLQAWLAASGFTLVEVGATLHRGAFVVTAKPRATSADRTVRAAPAVSAAVETAEGVAALWRGAATRLSGIEGAIQGRSYAIYGAGLYGSFLKAGLSYSEEPVGFVDRNPFLQASGHLGKPVFAPGALPVGVTDVLVGLNPAHARQTVTEIEEWRDRSLTFHYPFDVSEPRQNTRASA